MISIRRMEQVLYGKSSRNNIRLFPAQSKLALERGKSHSEYTPGQVPLRGIAGPPTCEEIKSLIPAYWHLFISDRKPAGAVIAGVLRYKCSC